MYIYMYIYKCRASSTYKIAYFCIFFQTGSDIIKLSSCLHTVPRQSSIVPFTNLSPSSLSTNYA